MTARPGDDTAAPGSVEDNDTGGSDQRRSLVLTIGVLSLVVLLCAGGIAGGYLLLSRSSAGTTSTPVGAVQGYLTALFIDRDAKEIEKYVCASGDRLRDDLATLQRTIAQSSASVDVSWANLREESRTGDRATVTADVTFEVAVGERATTALEKIKFTVVREAGWRVCAADTV